MLMDSERQIIVGAIFVKSVSLSVSVWVSGRRRFMLMDLESKIIDGAIFVVSVSRVSVSVSGQSVSFCAGGLRK